MQQLRLRHHLPRMRPRKISAERAGAEEPEPATGMEPAGWAVTAQPADTPTEVVTATLEEEPEPVKEDQPRLVEEDLPPVVYEPGNVEPGNVEPGNVEPGLELTVMPEPTAAAPAEDGEAVAEAPSGSDFGQEPAPVVEEPADEVVAGDDIAPEQPPPETVGGEGDTTEESRERRGAYRFLRSYKIQEVIKRRQILLVQVVKEERGTKGAALTTYLSLAGRFGVLMPNSPRGGGISRKITSATDRRRLREIMAELDIPAGMGLIVRTAGANRPKAEIKRDCEYLLRLWDDIRDNTMNSVAPALIYEEASLIKRAIRDVYSRDIDEIVVDGEPGWRAAHEFMRMLMPSHAKKVQLWKNGGMPLFAKHQVDAQLDAMLMPTAQLRSGGYLVINQTEALVAIDVNSGRSTRERGIEETALRTNLEAADELARQLRLRDLAGLIVIDFIDMETRKHNAMVEKRLKEALKNDRARIQIGHISHFGLMEMSRQRLRPSLAETSFITCSHCGGTGHVRSTESAAIHVLRGVEEEGAKRRAAEIVVYVAPQVALYILNHKRERLAGIEQRYGMHVLCVGDDIQMNSQFRIERLRAQVASEVPAAITQDAGPPSAEAESEEEIEAGEEDEEETETQTGDRLPGESAEDAERRHRRRRRRRRGGGRREEAPAMPASGEEAPEAEPAAETRVEGVPEHAEDGEDEHRNRRRGRRGGRRRRHEGNGEMPAHAEPGAEQPELPPVYSGPTPANPFGGPAFDIFDVLEPAEQAAPTLVEAAPVVPDPATAAASPIILDEPEPAQAQAMSGEAEALKSPDLEEQGTSPEPIEAPEPDRLPEPEPVPANDVAPEPLVKPIIVGGDQEAVVEKKRGWWRR